MARLAQPERAVYVTCAILVYTSDRLMKPVSIRHSHSLPIALGRSVQSSIVVLRPYGDLLPPPQDISHQQPSHRLLEST